MLPPTLSLVQAVNVLKTNSSRFLHKQGIAFEWQKGYGAFSVSQSQVEKVTAYIRTQPEHHRRMTYEEEFMALLKKARIAYDPKYFLG